MGISKAFFQLNYSIFKTLEIMKSIAIIAVLFTIMYSTSCKKESQNTDFANNAICVAPSPTYSSEIATILNSNCAHQNYRMLPLTSLIAG
jgi:hypothetical protein